MADFLFVAPIPVLETGDGPSVDLGVLTTTNATPAEAEWDNGTIYDEGATAYVGADVYVSQQAGNTGHDPTSDDGTYWVRAGVTNPYAMFDASTSTKTVNADTIQVTLTPGKRFNALYLYGLNGASVTVEIEDPDDGVIYDETFDLTNNDAVYDWYTWLTEPIVRSNDLLVLDLPSLYSGAEVTITIDNTGGDAECAVCVLGYARQLGMSLAGATVGIKDYSRKDVDAFNNTILRRGKFSRLASMQVLVQNNRIDHLFSLLTEYRATAAVYIGSEEYGLTALYGFFRDLNVEIAYPNHSLCTLDLEGLT